ncbi:major facilitator superfamily domain-containing protein 4A-like [Anneissia japonica]|uniref:major facilitator superfamily domain-containing protein 4A-like n=1 Tax=Anneissia japonica TaxID=1529436 RepID=UPI0014258FAA|nr:major facilitator superfamily domain-containing protein 4A-like [Anneissia japonica]
MFGLFLSSIYPTVIALAEQYIHMTGFVTSCVVIGAASGEMAFPVIVGRLFFAFGPPSFFIFCTIVSFIGICVYIVLCCIGQYHMRSRKYQLILKYQIALRSLYCRGG